MIPHLEQRIAFLTACRDHGLENVEWRFNNPGEGWKRALDRLPGWAIENNYEFRIRPRTHVIPKAAVPMPLKVKPTRYEKFYYLDFDRLGVEEFEWAGFEPEIKLFKNGFVFATREDAEANLRAMLAREEE